jgi:uncharacterized OB-fold protein
MTPGLTVWKCQNCGAAYFPERYLCSACGSDRMTTATAMEGTVEETTTVRHVIGQPDWQPRRIATVKTDDGPRILAGLLDESGPDDRVVLLQEEGAPHARRKA